jgi:hypothetical protein
VGGRRFLDKSLGEVLSFNAGSKKILRKVV